MARLSPAQTVASLGLCFLLLLASPGRVAAQDSASRLFPRSADNGWLVPSETASLTRSFPVYRLPEESRDHEPWMASADLGTDASLRFGLRPRRPTGTPLTSADALSLPATEPASWTQPCPTHELTTSIFGLKSMRTFRRSRKAFDCYRDASFPARCVFKTQWLQRFPAECFRPVWIS